MKTSTSLMLPLVGLAVLTLVVIGLILWPPQSVTPASPGPASTPAAVAPAGPSSPQAPSRRPEALPPSPAVSSPQVVPPEKATVVPVGPGDEVPSQELANPLPQTNDPLAPEKPQTARWKLEKTQRINTLLTRDVERLKQDRDAAKARGDTAELKHLDTLIERNQGRLLKLREEMDQLTRQAESEPPEP